MKISGTKMDFCQLKSWPREGHVTPLPSFFSRTFFLFSFTRFLPFFSAFLLLLRPTPEAAPSVAFVCTSCSSLLLPHLHLRAAAAEAAAKTGRQRQQQELVGPPSFPARSRWFQASNLKLVT